MGGSLRQEQHMAISCLHILCFLLHYFENLDYMGIINKYFQQNSQVVLQVLTCQNGLFDYL